MHSLKSKKQVSHYDMVIKTCITKAYDRLERDFFRIHIKSLQSQWTLEQIDYENF